MGNHPDQQQSVWRQAATRVGVETDRLQETLSDNSVIIDMTDRGGFHGIQPSMGPYGPLWFPPTIMTHQEGGLAVLPTSQSCPAPSGALPYSQQSLTTMADGRDATPYARPPVSRARSTGGGGGGWHRGIPRPSTGAIVQAWDRSTSAGGAVSRTSMTQPSLRRSMEERLPRDLRRRLTNEYGSQRTRKLKTFNDLHTW